MLQLGSHFFQSQQKSPWTFQYTWCGMFGHFLFCTSRVSFGANLVAVVPPLPSQESSWPEWQGRDEAMPPCFIRKILGSLAMKYIQHHTTNQYNSYLYNIFITLLFQPLWKVQSPKKYILLIMLSGNLIVHQAIVSRGWMLVLDFFAVHRLKSKSKYLKHQWCTLTSPPKNDLISAFSPLNWWRIDQWPWAILRPINVNTVVKQIWLRNEPSESTQPVKAI